MKAMLIGALLLTSLCVGCVSSSYVRMAARESGIAAGREAMQRGWRMETYDAEVVHIVNNPPHQLSSSGYHTIVYKLRCLSSTTQEIDYVEGTYCSSPPRLSVGDIVKVKVAVEKTANIPLHGTRGDARP